MAAAAIPARPGAPGKPGSPSRPGAPVRPDPRFSALHRRDYRLIDSLHQPHPQLDGLYESIDDAIADAISWLEGMGPVAANTSIGLEVSTPSGSWRTIRQPELLLCPLPCPW
jgi:hypothetical protein